MLILCFLDGVTPPLAGGEPFSELPPLADFVGVAVAATLEPPFLPMTADLVKSKNLDFCTEGIDELKIEKVENALWRKTCATLRIENVAPT